MPEQPLKLDYAPGRRRPASPARVTATVVLTLVLFPAHLWYTGDIPWRLWELWGGIQAQGRVTSFGSAWAPTVPLHAPGGLMFYIDIKSRGLYAYRHDPAAHGNGPVVMLLLALGSLAAAYFLASLPVAMLWRDRLITGRYCWRFWGILLGWGWILVPAEMSWIFQWTVVY